jgi:tetratricopeptide (TPR) repeat protein
MTKEQDILDLIKTFTSYIRQRNTEKAKTVFKIIVKLNIALSQNIVHEIDDLADAFKTYKNASFFINEIDKNLNKKNGFLYLIKLEMMVYSNINDKEELEKSLIFADTSIKNFPNITEFLNIKSIILAELGKKLQALQYINHALSLDSENTDYMSNKALLLFEMKKKDEAMETIEIAIGINPDDLDLRENKRYIEYYEDIDSYTDQTYKEIEKFAGKFTEIEEKFANKFTEVKDDIKNAKFEFVGLAALFLAVLAITFKIITFDYKNFEKMNYWDFFHYQIAINLPWFLALVFVLVTMGVIIFFLRVKRSKK